MRYVRKPENIRTCKLCKTVFHKKSQGHHGPPIYCSVRCATAAKKSRQQYICQFCAHPFERKQSYAMGKSHGNGKFCSKDCHNKSMVSEVSLLCKQCGAPFTVIHNRRSTAAFCSRKCKIHFKGETTIERNVRMVLDKFQIEYKQEHCITRGIGSGRHHFYSIDFYLPDARIALEVDGTYWHRDRQEYDKTRSSFLESKGIRTIRISDTELGSEYADAVIFRKLLRGL